jgi:hypothetical protein
MVGFPWDVNGISQLFRNLKLENIGVSMGCSSDFTINYRDQNKEKNWTNHL